MNDYVVTLNHDIIVYVTAELFVIRDRNFPFQDYVSFFIDSDEVVSFLDKDVVQVAILHADDSLEKVYGIF